MIAGICWACLSHSKTVGNFIWVLFRTGNGHSLRTAAGNLFPFWASLFNHVSVSNPAQSRKNPMRRVLATCKSSRKLNILFATTREFVKITIWGDSTFLLALGKRLASQWNRTPFDGRISSLTFRKTLESFQILEGLKIVSCAAVAFDNLYTFFFDHPSDVGGFGCGVHMR